MGSLRRNNGHNIREQSQERYNRKKLLSIRAMRVLEAEVEPPKVRLRRSQCARAAVPRVTSLTSESSIFAALGTKMFAHAKTPH